MDIRINLVFFAIFVIRVSWCDNLLFDYGNLAGDTSRVTNDDDSYEVSLVEPFVFFGNLYNSTYFSDNGVLSFQPFRGFFSQSSILSNVYPPIALVLHDDFIGRGASVYYRSQPPNTNDREKAKKYVEELFPQLTNYEPSAITVVTWDGFRSYRERDEDRNKNTFQGVLVHDNTNPVVLMLYKEINRLDRESVVGVRLDNMTAQELPISRNSNLLLNLERTSQANTKGLFGFLVKQGVNQCALPNLCDENAKCSRTQTSYTCSCETGYRGNGYECEEICIRSCTGRPDGNYQYCDGCQAYVSCSNGRGTVMECATGDVYWDDDLGYCEWSSNTCKIENEERCVSDCSDAFNGLYKSCESCKEFVDCRGGVAYRKTCATKEKWNVRIRRCDYETNVNCTP